jgi:hypothetical protein
VWLFLSIFLGMWEILSLSREAKDTLQPMGSAEPGAQLFDPWDQQNQKFGSRVGHVSSVLCAQCPVT